MNKEIDIFLKYNLKKTPHRVLVYEFLKKTHGPFTPQVIFKALEKKGIDKVTIYRTLHTFEEKGIVKSIHLSTQEVYVELADDHDHHHIVCSKCRKISNFTGCGISSIIADALAQTGFVEVNTHSLELFGLCKKCK